jgi:hypothetical protein
VPYDGIKQIQVGRKICEETGALLTGLYLLILLAEALCKANRLEDGRTALEEALASIENNWEGAYKADIIRHRPEFLLAVNPMTKPKRNR